MAHSHCVVSPPHRRGCATILKLSPNLRRIAKEPEPKLGESGIPPKPSAGEKGEPPKKPSQAELEAAKMDWVLTDIDEHGIYRCR